MNNKSTNITVDEVYVHTYGPDHVLAHEHPAFNLFDARTCFTRKGIKYLAVAVSLISNKPEKPQSCSFRACLVNTTTGENVSARTFSVRMAKGETRSAHRADLPLKADMVHERYDYELRVISLRDNSVCASRAVRFRQPYKPAMASAYISWPGSAERMCHLSADADVKQSLMLEFDEAATCDTESHEICVHISGRHGYRHTCVITFKPSEQSVATCPIPSDAPAYAPLTFAVESLGRAVAQFSADKADSWREGNIFYSHASSAKLQCDNFDALLDEFIAGQKAEFDEKECAPASQTQEETKSTSALYDLNSLIGLEKVKQKVQSIYSVSRFFGMRCEAGLSFPRMPLHALFLGAPGTGKTTVAGIMGRLLKEAGALSKGHVVVRERSTIVGKYYGDEEKAVREAIEEARGGILFIDEAYQLCRRDDPKDPGRLALEAMMTSLSDTSQRDWMLILAGYTAPMLELLETNPGLKSRIPATNHYVFDDYNAEQLEQIADKYLIDNQFSISDEARGLLRKLLIHDYSERDDTFGNARHVLNLLETGVLPAMAERVVSLTNPGLDELRTIEASDIPAPSAATFRPRPRLGFAV